MILVSQVWPLKVGGYQFPNETNLIKHNNKFSDGFDFMRDVIAFMCVVVAIIAVAFDGKV